MSVPPRPTFARGLLQIFLVVFMKELITLDAWKFFGLAAQAIFFGRFFVQWIVSERKGESTVPVMFWVLSVFGGALLLVYAIHQRDIVFILGQAGGLVIYTRNLMLIYQKSQRDKS